MATGRRHLAGDEELIHVTRRHWTTVVGAFTALVAIAAAAAVVVRLLPFGEEWARWTSYAVIAAAVVAAVLLWLMPFLRWWSDLYILSDRRLMNRYGLLTQHGRDIPLSRVNDVSYSMSLGDRITGRGTLTVRSAAEQDGLELRGIPRVRWLQSEIYRVVEDSQRREAGPGRAGREERDEDGPPPDPGESP
ncbi:PH domain-containing protein [Streptomonospora salina]|uniref:Membrane protein YdbS with pleckstrin-like domain n=1 Tax=Streptomonospora salina TaxID=104205 RepID=A0A841E615_9ACTN|nr:PH domain-containing protein [Streptomonospora salina]MBB5999347.1 membrane protein YdbS with pleckstrin-like domain [Streptomonospora salina]